MLSNSDIEMAPQADFVVNRNTILCPDVDIREDKISLQNRLLAVQKELNKVQKENSILKMKSAITLGQMRLHFESIQEDNKFLIEKCFDLKKKIEVSKQSFKSKKNELATLQSTIQDA